MSEQPKANYTFSTIQTPPPMKNRTKGGKKAQNKQKKPKKN